MRITEKLLLVFIPTFLLSVVTMTLFSRRAVEEALIQSVVKSGHAMSINLNQSQGMVRSFAMGNESLLLPPLQQMLESTGALYGMILDPDSRVLAHTNVVEKGKVYSDHVTMDAVRSERPQHAILEVDGLKVMDFAFPVWALDRTHTGEEFLLLGKRARGARRRLGTIRLGLSLEESLGTAATISDRVFWIVTIVNIVAMGLSLFYIRRVLRPVRLMVDATDKLGRGELGGTVTISSRDEMGDLAHSFNRMSRELAATTVSRDLLDSILANMRDVLIVANPDGTIRQLNQRVVELIDRPREELIGHRVSRLFAEEDQMFSPEGLIELRRDRTIASIESALVDRSGRRIAVLMSVAGFRGRSEEEIEGFIISATDIGERIAAEDLIRQSLEEKELLLKEIHHRVKNNLQIISSLLNLQSRAIEDTHALEMLADSQNRVKSMALIHEKLYQSEDLARVDFADYIQALASSLFQSYQMSTKIRLRVEVQDVMLGIDQAIPCGLIVNELVSNALKHGFVDGDDGTVVVRFESAEGGRVALHVEDDGVGIAESIDVQTTESLGLNLVSILVSQLNGDITLENTAGTHVTVLFAPDARSLVG